ncbi:MAG: hypothetical protein EXR96_06005 [Nitrospiraceae bacterium]|nr:hypothetical protein [Nitrospiraceae bacterium]
MFERQTFWPVECEAGEPDLLVCMSCLNEVFKRKVPMPDCPACHGVSTYEAFTLEAIRDWGTDPLIEKAVRANAEVEQPVPSTPALGLELPAE